MKEQLTYYSNGKLLITGEYVVLDGATALAIPTKYGQSLCIKKSTTSGIHWISKDHTRATWFEAQIETETLTASNRSNISDTLCTILQTARNHNPSFLKKCKGLTVVTALDFPRDWGLGTSSTLINNIAQWAQIDAFTLLKESFGGSGYDIAAAQHNTPIFYTVKREEPEVLPCTLSWSFTDHLFFVHLNQKKDSKKGIEAYKNIKKDARLVETISDLSKKTLVCYTLQDFERILNAHEQKISKLLAQPTIKQMLFKDYPNTIKSLGAWGGDFVLATGNNSDMDYFKNKGYNTIIPFQEMIA
ncbi:MAG: mevalonate kinase [Candidatus Paceibacteria bacterium]